MAGLGPTGSSLGSLWNLPTLVGIPQYPWTFEHVARATSTLTFAKETLMSKTRDLTAIQQGMFGCTTRLIDADVATARKDSLSREPVKAMVLGLLSDAQEMIAMDRQERAERLINRVKYIVDEHLSEEAQ